MENLYKIGTTEISKKEQLYEIKIKDEVIKHAALTLIENEKLYVKNVGEILLVENTQFKTLFDYLKYKNNLMEYKDICKLVYDTVYLEKTLEKNNKCITYFDLNDIIVIGEKVFLFLNDKKVSEIEDGNLKITYPLDKSLPFLYPEIKTAQAIPIITSYKAGYYSLGLLVLRLLLPEKGNMIVLDEKIKEILYPTSLYWFLIHALNFVPEERKLIML